jgi:hypothetical protein
MTESGPRPDQEGFGEASLGEAQAENPALDPEMLEDGEPAEAGDEAYGGDQDAEPSATEGDEDPQSERDQAEG